MSRPKLDGVAIAELRALLESPGWNLVAEELAWRDGETCEGMRSCGMEELRRLQGRTVALREAANLPASMIAEWESQQREGARR